MTLELTPQQRRAIDTLNWYTPVRATARPKCRADIPLETAYALNRKNLVQINKIRDPKTKRVKLVRVWLTAAGETALVEMEAQRLEWHRLHWGP